MSDIPNVNAAYQEKKELKKKIIERIDFLEKGNNKHSQMNAYQEDKDKSGGINLMGYFNQAIKKIKSTIPEKTV